MPSPDLYSSGLVDDTSQIIGACHDCQIVDEKIVAEDYDTAIDWIVTPTRILATSHEYLRPNKGIIWTKLAPGMREKIPPIQELWCKSHCK